MKLAFLISVALLIVVALIIGSFRMFKDVKKGYWKL